MSAPTVLVSSLGLMGGSLAAALTRAGWPVLLHHRRPEVARQAQQLGYGTSVDDDLAGALGRSDLVVVCTPVSAIAPTVRMLAAMHPRPIFTDVGSVKGSLCSDLAELTASGRFIGSHPMAGSHLDGLAHARADLYQGCMTILTPAPTTPAPALALIEALWRAVGSRLCQLSPEAHDRAVAEASHLPHVLASAAASRLGAAAAPLAAGGFRDTTRIAGGNTAMWSDILTHNRAEVTLGLAALRAHLAALEQALHVEDGAAVRAWLEAGRAGRLLYEQHALNPLPPQGEEA